MNLSDALPSKLDGVIVGATVSVIWNITVKPLGTWIYDNALEPVGEWISDKLNDVRLVGFVMVVDINFNEVTMN